MPKTIESYTEISSATNRGWGDGEGGVGKGWGGGWWCEKRYKKEWGGVNTSTHQV